VASDGSRELREAEKELSGSLPKIRWPWLEIAERELGVSEVSGSKHNPRIVEYHKTTTLAAVEDEVPWCASFVNWCLKEAGIKGSGLASARSFLQWGYPVDKFTKGAIVIFKRGSKSWQGHVGFAVDENFLAIKVLGGNQSNKVCYKWYLKKDFLGYRWPKDKA
jgi:uncharacterized protein (TIGR02594 family)